MAVGISCAGTANKEALDLLTPMLADQTDFVRQGALVRESVSELVHLVIEHMLLMLVLLSSCCSQLEV